MKTEYYEDFKRWTDLLQQFGFLEKNSSAHTVLKTLESKPEPTYVFAYYKKTNDIFKYCVILSEDGKTFQAMMGDYNPFYDYLPNDLRGLWNPKPMDINEIITKSSWTTYSSDNIQKELLIKYWLVQFDPSLSPS